MGGGKTEGLLCLQGYYGMPGDLGTWPTLYGLENKKEPRLIMVKQCSTMFEQYQIQNTTDSKCTTQQEWMGRPTPVQSNIMFVCILKHEM